MSLKIKSSIVGTLAIICGFIAVIFALAPITFIYDGIVVLIFMTLYAYLKDVYRDLRCKEIDEELKNRGR